MIVPFAIKTADFHDLRSRPAFRPVSLAAGRKNRFFCFGFGSLAAKTKAKEGFSLAAAGEKALMLAASAPTA